MSVREGEELKEQGMALALSREDVPPWRERFEDVVHKMKVGTTFTSEDVIESYGVGLPSGEVALHGNNAVGAVMNALSTAKVIEKAGYHVKSRRRNSHGAELTVWRRA